MNFYCTWCGDEIDEDDVSLPDQPGENAVGRCDDDGLVYVTSDPDEVEA